MAAPLPLPFDADPDPQAATSTFADLPRDALPRLAADLLNAIAAADTSDDGEPILAAAGHAATAALLLLQHRAAGDADPAGSRAHLREVYAICADQTAIVRELLRELATPRAVPAAAPEPAAAPAAAGVIQPLASGPTAACPPDAAERHRLQSI